ncbi:hypothetical protein [uncultured Jatrophihabitans sp.]|uniref:TRAFAC clade GTPase domain-containing protein n=1 Tax=uncultured Jatrophihabitans sp. TaxID=1610747 RepID=UPI0035CB9362
MTPFNEAQPTGILFSGLPSTGKTTYLALLYLAIVEDRAARLKLGRYSDDREYLNGISARLQRCEPAVRTEVDEQKTLSLSLLVGPEERSTILQIPDTSGELWEAALVERHMPTEIDERARNAEAVVIFVHCKNDFDSGTTIEEAGAADAAAHGETAPSLTGEDHPPGRSPTQVELVELLQILREDRGPRPARGCLAVSAFDLVPQPMTPDEWVASNLPLLAQYVQVNRDWLEFTTFGVSAQGGRFDRPDLTASLLAQDALDRASLVWADGTVGEIGDPVLWALNIRG